MYMHIYVSTCVHICTYMYSCNGTKMREKNVKYPFFILRTIKLLIFTLVRYSVEVTLIIYN